MKMRWFLWLGVWVSTALYTDWERRPLMGQPSSTAMYSPFPPDLPLPSLPPNDDWPRTAVVLQTWGRTQWVAIAQHRQWAERLRNDFGFNALVVLPPDAHNTTRQVYRDATGRLRLSEETFREALAHYRRVGFRIILYSSIMHCGRATIWMSGELTKAHPDWVQRDRDGNPRTLFGGQWLCPSTPALDFTLRYTQELVRTYGADAIMLDNNQFFLSDARQPTCYCEHCQRSFRAYVRRRFGQTARSFFGVDADEVTIPTDEKSDLFRLWIHWRNRVWAEANEAFRRGLRAVRPDVVLLANTQYGYRSWYLATDLQYAHEDVVLSESRGLTSWQMSAKLLLGQALADGRPLWNYVGTFEERKERGHEYLRPPKVIRRLLAATFAHQANPWIVFYGFDTHPDENAASLEALRQYVHWFSQHAERLGGSQPEGSVGIFFSLRSRNYVGTPLIPRVVEALLRAGLPLRGLVDENFRPEKLEGIRVLVMPSVVCLAEEAARWIGEWVRRGGMLVASPDCGWRDEYGRSRPQSALMNALGVTAEKPHLRVGRGEVRWFNADSMEKVLPALRDRCRDVVVGGKEDLEIRIARNEEWRFVHLLRHEAEEPASLTLHLARGLFPKGLPTKAIWLSPESKDGTPLPLSTASDGTLTIRTPPFTTYGIVAWRTNARPVGG